MRDPVQKMNESADIAETIPLKDRRTAAELLPTVYQELRKLAAFKMAREKPGHTLQPTALVHEAYFRLLGAEDSAPWGGRTHFFAAAAEAMRRILIESARRKQRLRHGGGLERVDVDEVDLPLPMPSEDLLALDAAIQNLANVDPCSAQVVKLCFFAGLTQDQAAHELGISVATAERRWSFARAWLYRELRKENRL
jgi:RNA polymerase sigma factor (TIGR02999 family)